VILAREKIITEDVIEKYLYDREYEPVRDQTTYEQSTLTEEERIRAALVQSKANIKQTAKILGIDRSTLYRRFKKYNIQIGKDLK